ncbi:hypothetical protein AYK26_05770 [Euryarchaeota archaeon SM23-78]|nr:MAG: hypothetical protein AYK26_05770 [Euryarchaeota archaeon SM23-78]MBW3000983.1 hypothetical protein [Candidatus Woesearchaeota archaeon]
MKGWNLVLISLLLFSIFFITSCGEKTECTSSSECLTGNPCLLGRCKDGKCVTNVKPDCCPNANCEEDAGENKCMCPQDCGKCEGKVTYTVETYRGPKEVEAKYAEYRCENNKCIVGVDPAIVNTPSYRSDIDIRGGFQAEIVTTLNQPFDTSKDKINIRLKLKNIDSDVVDGVTFTNIQVLSVNELIGEKDINYKLINVGDMFEEELDISLAQTMVESEKDLSFNYDYTYTAIERSEQVVYRAALKDRLTKLMIIVP